eukprot:INCI213.1.p1 GENE.INCI213.1~~INCI213.1.p1  ORF type:complete len:337 (+),score=19.18 INCI213.1:304-1314(+)
MEDVSGLPPRGLWATRLTRCFSARGWSVFIVLLSVFLITVFSLSLSFALQSLSHGVIGGERGWEPLVSSFLGWAYFLAWSISFYPQVFQNWQHRSVVGLSFDFMALNILGFVCYFLFSLEFFSNSHVQEEYETIHNGNRNVVQVQDLVFAGHAVVLSTFTGAQIVMCGYNRGGQRVSWWSLGFIAVVVVLAIVYAGLCFARDDKATPSNMFFTWVNFLYFLSIVKLVISAIKYIPQAALNFKRKSTVGWNIWNVLLDFSGGSLSLAQLVMDSAHNHDWTAILGDPVKFGLSILSILFDILFMVQHYILYPAHKRTPKPSSNRQGSNNALSEVLLDT